MERQSVNEVSFICHYVLARNVTTHTVTLFNTCLHFYGSLSVFSLKLFDLISSYKVPVCTSSGKEAQESPFKGCIHCRIQLLNWIEQLLSPTNDF